MLATLVDTAALWKIVLAAFAGGVGLTAIFGIGAIRVEALSRSAPERSGGDRAASTVVVVVCAAIWLAALVVGFIAMTHK